MKLEFDLPTDHTYHQFCPQCHSEQIEKILKDEKTFYICKECHGTFPRLIVIDPQIVWWVDKNTKEYWHESVGVFIFNDEHEALFFERVLFPFVFTIPAGHVDVGENALDAAQREILEETGLTLNNLKLIFEDDLDDDPCRRGADCHRWHLYAARFDGGDIKINDEGLRPVWMTLDDALNRDITNPVRYSIEKYRDKLLKI